MNSPEFSQLVSKHAQVIREWRDWWEPRIRDDQIEFVARVVAHRELNQPVPEDLAPYEELRSKLRRRSFC